MVEDELATRGAVLHIPAFTRRKKQMTAKDMDISRQIAHVRIKTTIPIAPVDLTDNIIVTTAGIINLNACVL